MYDPLTAPSASLNSARPGARVVVRSPQGSAFDRATGTVRVVEGTTAMVALDSGTTLPFGLGELTALSSATRPDPRASWPVDHEDGKE